jgi:hypothetical protein
MATMPAARHLHGRRLDWPVQRARPFCAGARRSRHDPVPLSDLERMLVLGAMGGTTGWHFSITRNARYAPHLAN